MSALYFKRVSYKNILSTGNQWTQIDLDKSKSTLIVGDNGAGKSTMLDAICFALYGKPFRKINKPQLMNSINQKDLKVEVSFKAGGKDYVVVRGMKPNIFEIWRNNELINQDAAARDYQSYLEENILKMNMKSFGQIVVLGSSTFVPFMQLPAGQRREVIEDLLDIQIFTTMNVLLKEKVSDNKTEVQELKYHIDLAKDRIQAAKDHNDSIRTMKEDEVKKIKDRVKEHLDYIESEQSKIDEIESHMDEFVQSIQDKTEVKKKLSEIQEIDNELKTKFNRLSKEIKFFEQHDDCPTCKQGIESEFKQGTISQHGQEVNKITDAREKLAAKALEKETRLNEISEVEDDISKLHLHASECRANIKLTKNTLNGIKKDLLEAEKEVEAVDTSKIKELEEELKTYHIKQEQLLNDKEVLGILGSMLKDGGIKTRIIKQYVPVMNKLINKYLASMDFFVDFQLDEGFNETIKSRFRDAFSYSSFSEGEKARIDLALLLTWRGVSRLRNSVSTNLLIMDEVFDGSLDSEGSSSLFDILSNVIDDTNLFVISHNKADQFQDKFDNIIKFQKVKNFSIHDYK